MSNYYTKPPTKTTYKGVVFRSYLESLWARHFDQIGIKWQYEPGIERFTNCSYLPDFKIEIDWSEEGRYNMEIYLEVKPSIDVWSKALYQQRSLFRFADRLFLTSREYLSIPDFKRIFVLCGYPNDNMIIYFDATNRVFSGLSEDDKERMEFPLFEFGNKVLGTIGKKLGFVQNLSRGDVRLGNIIFNKNATINC